MDKSSLKEIKFYYEYEKYGEFSNFFASEFILDGKTWPTTEHYFQGIKFQDVNDQLLETIRTAKTPDEAKKIAVENKKTRRADWDYIKYLIMVKCNIAKYTQHKKLKELLLETGDAILIENSQVDYTWGCGADGTGKNLLGKALMEVREILREAEKSK